MKNPIHILVVEGRFYHHISDQLIAGAEMALREQGATWEVVMVPGALEVPQVLAVAIDAGLFSETTPAHFMGSWRLAASFAEKPPTMTSWRASPHARSWTLSTTHSIPLGNGILTVENEEQAIARASVTGKNKGRDAVEACLEVLRHKRDFAKRAH